MPLSAGDKLGPYEVISPIGAGGIGEVYKARDTRLDRMVAVKVLPDHIAKRDDLRAASNGSNYDIAPDGKRLAGFTEDSEKLLTHLTFLLNFADELRRRAPTGR